MFRLPFLLLMLAGSVSAQTPATAPATGTTPPAAALAPAPYTTADTVRAIHRLFAKRRKVGNLLTLGAVGADLAAAGISAASEGAPKSSGGAYGWSAGGIHFGFGGFAAIYGIAVAPVMGVGIQQLIAYGPRREAKILARYNATGELPAKIKRQVRKHFQLH